MFQNRTDFLPVVTNSFFLRWLNRINNCSSIGLSGFDVWFVELRTPEAYSESASVLGLVDKPAHRHAQAVAKEAGLDLSRHRSQPVTPELAEWADYVLGMEIQHSSKLRARYPDLEDKLLLLGSFGGMVEIQDPLGSWRRRFRITRDELQRCTQAFLDQLPRKG